MSDKQQKNEFNDISRDNRDQWTKEGQDLLKSMLSDQKFKSEHDCIVYLEQAFVSLYRKKEQEKLEIKDELEGWKNRAITAQSKK